MVRLGSSTSPHNLNRTCIALSIEVVLLATGVEVKGPKPLRIIAFATGVGVAWSNDTSESSTRLTTLIAVKPACALSTSGRFEAVFLHSEIYEQIPAMLVEPWCHVTYNAPSL